MNAELKEYDDKEHEEYLTEIYGTVEICGMTFDSGSALQELDPTAFRVSMADREDVWICGECKDEHDDEDQAEECCKEACPECGELHDTEEEAGACCEEEDED